MCLLSEEEMKILKRHRAGSEISVQAAQPQETEVSAQEPRSQVEEENGLRYVRRTRRVLIAHAVVRRIEAFLLIAAFIYIFSTAWDMYTFTEAGNEEGGFPGFEALWKRNTDIAGWIRMDGTHIDHPVVHGRDNFEYLSLDAYGEYYQGGSIFLDAGNAEDFSDQYIIIHGHHMTRGAMFSDVTEYLREDFFRENTSGELITPGGVYELTAAGSKLADAYDDRLYYTGNDAGRPLWLMADCTQHRDLDFDEKDKLVVLSTCAGDMSSSRAVLFLRARKMDGEDDHT